MEGSLYLTFAQPNLLCVHSVNRKWPPKRNITSNSFWLCELQCKHKWHRAESSIQGLSSGYFKVQSQNHSGQAWLSLSEALWTLQPVSLRPASLNPGLSVCDAYRHLSLWNTQSESQQQPLSICTASLSLSLCLSSSWLSKFFFVLEQRETG